MKYCTVAVAVGVSKSVYNSQNACWCFKDHQSTLHMNIVSSSNVTEWVRTFLKA